MLASSKMTTGRFQKDEPRPPTGPEAEATSAPPLRRRPRFPETSGTESPPPAAQFIGSLREASLRRLRRRAEGLLYLQVTVLQVPDPEGLLTVVERQHGLHPVHKQLQALLQGRDVIGQAGVLVNLLQTSGRSELSIRTRVLVIRDRST